MNMSVYCGVDIGSVAAKGALIGADGALLHTVYRRSHGKNVQAARSVMAELLAVAGERLLGGIGFTGAGGELVSSLVGGLFFNEIIAQSRAVAARYPHVRTVVEMGGEDSKLLLFKEEEGRTVLEDFAMNTLCAAGTGSFLDQQASRMGYAIAEEFGAMALKSRHAPRIAGRCSVFAKSDMIHLQQIGAPDYEIIAGLCAAVARSFVANVGRGKRFVVPVAFFGGVAKNAGVVKGLADELGIGVDELFIPDECAVTGALGAALAAREADIPFVFAGLEALDRYEAVRDSASARMAPLTGERNDDAYRTVVKPLPAGTTTGCYLGVDIGSLSTNVALLDESMAVVARRYLRTQSRPLEAVTRGLREIGEEVGDRVVVKGVGVTGSGRYMIGEYIGADIVRNEITAQATASLHFVPDADTLFEIGGQDSKYVAMRDGAVVDFEMNKVCAAGTGSFIEEQAEKLALSIEREFSDTAFAATAPGKFGDRCTVFIESDLVANQQKGMSQSDLAAGLAYSIVSNYLNRVVGDRRIGDRILFQGGVAWNKAVVAAFEAVTGKAIVVPPHHDVAGAVGAAIIARRHHERTGLDTPSSFVGFDLSARTWNVTTFECKACDNVCDISRVRFDREAHYYGARCDLFDGKAARSRREKGDQLPDLFAERERLLFGDWLTKKNFTRAATPGAIRIGVPRALYAYEHFPFWSALLSGLGFEVVLSGKTNQKVIAQAVEEVKAETCFPIKVMHGHVADLLEKEIDYLFLPSTISVNAPDTGFAASHTCPMVQSIPYMIRAAIDLSGVKVLEPPLFFQRGKNDLVRELSALFGREFGLSSRRIREAVSAGCEAQAAFAGALVRRGREVIEDVQSRGGRPVAIISRSYNGCDSGINLDLPRKLRDMGKVAVPIDFLDLDESAALAESPDMYWRSGQRMIAAAVAVRRDPRLDAIMIGNFKCGPDSFIEYHLKKALGGKPMLALEIDEHSADAGAITRCEAFFDSLENVDSSLFAAEALAAKAVTAGAPPPIAAPRTKTRDRTLYLPYMCDHGHVLAAALRGAGVKAELLPVTDQASLDLGYRYSSGKECVPFTMTTGDIVKKATEPGFDPGGSAFFMPTTSGPCRFGQYQSVQKLFLEELGMPDVPLLSPDAKSGYDTGDGLGLGVRFRRDAWRGGVAVDILIKATLQTRPYETEPGATDRVYERCLREVVELVERDSSLLFAYMEEAQRK
ncbi:MAG: CoA activase, partial [Nitrospinae bacterium]|nr:CoA activase [Nitrospinota bacterium]